jgi:hypothetical protein
MPLSPESIDPRCAYCHHRVEWATADDASVDAVGWFCPKTKTRHPLDTDGAVLWPALAS